MELALYEPGLGYYSAGARKLGAAGDFVTAPEVAPVFSRCLAVQCGEVLRALGGGDVLELGAGSGVMARGPAAGTRERATRCRVATGSSTSAPTCASASARRSRPPCPRLLRPRRVARPAARGRSTGVVVANEVLDALPVERFVVRGGAGACARRDLAARAAAVVGGAGAAPRSPTRCVAIEQRRAARLARRLHLGGQPRARRLARGARRLRSRAACCCSWTTACRAASTTRRSAATARCCATSGIASTTIRFARPGLQDITAWVDFTAVAEAAQAAGLERRGLHDAGALPDRQRPRRVRRQRRRPRRREPRQPVAPGDGADAARRNGRALQGDRARERVRCAPARLRRPRSAPHAVGVHGFRPGHRPRHRAGPLRVPADLELGSPDPDPALLRLAGPGPRLRRRGAHRHAARAAAVLPAPARHHGDRVARLGVAPRAHARQPARVADPRGDGTGRDSPGCCSPTSSRRTSATRCSSRARSRSSAC